MREQIVFETLLFEIGKQFDQLTQERKAKDFMRRFLKLTPISESLSATSLHHKFVLREEGLYFQILCIETRQLQIQFPSRGEFRRLDPFNTDVLRVKSSISQIESKILEATSPVLSPEELRENTSGWQRTIRESLRGRPSSLFDSFELFKSTKLNRVFPRGTQAHLSVSIQSIGRTTVTVRVRPMTSVHQPELLTARFSKKLEMHLPSYDHARDIHLILFEAMHAETPIEVLAKIAWDSSTGQPAFLEFIQLASSPQVRPS